MDENSEELWTSAELHGRTEATQCRLLDRAEGPQPYPA
jgi:hypothetical protein